MKEIKESIEWNELQILTTVINRVVERNNDFLSYDQVLELIDINRKLTNIQRCFNHPEFRDTPLRNIRGVIEVN